ncbi:hypothetical protein [Paenibacillus sp. GCM10027626]|uniref:hypothetical protein n=1 Tax=Paenibacillus sp. GCM10027626 TaxID=3273411 RepID=UPI00362B1C06
MKKTVAIAGSTILLLTAGVSVWASSTSPSNPYVLESEPISHLNDHETYQETERPEIYEAMMKRWEQAKEKVIKHKLSKESNVTRQEWRIIPSSDIDLELTNGLSAAESTSFADALFSDQRKSNLGYGDYFPAVLLNEAKDRAILTWEKASGEIVAIDIKSKIDSSGKRTWYVDGEAMKIE